MVERDPALAFELFLAANRELKRAGKPAATNIRRALLVFGLARYLEHSKSYETLEQHLPPQFLRPTMNHLGRSYFAARIAERLAKLRGQVYAQDAFCFGLMCDLDRYVPKLVSATKLTAEPANLRTLLPGLATPLIASNPLHWCAETASKFAIETQHAWDPAGFSPILKTISDLLGIDTYNVESELAQTAIATALTSKHFNDYPAARNLMNPGPQKPTSVILFPEQSTHQSASPAAKNEQVSKIPKAPVSEFKRSKPFVLDKKSLTALEATIDKATQDLEVLGRTKSTRARTLPFTLNVMTSVLKANKMFFVANANDGQLIVRLQASRGTKPKSANTALSANDNVVLKKGIASGKPLHINPQQLATHGKLFDAKLLKLLKGYDVYSIPLQGKHKVIGIMLARFDHNTTDNWPTHFNLCIRLTQSTVAALSATSD